MSRIVETIKNVALAIAKACRIHSWHVPNEIYEMEIVGELKSMGVYCERVVVCSICGDIRAHIASHSHPCLTSAQFTYKELKAHSYTIRDQLKYTNWGFYL